MPDRGQPDEGGTELLELRVLDGPNRFFTRPAVKVEFTDADPGRAAEAAQRAGDAVRELYEALDLRPPRLAHRQSVDGTRALVAFPWRRRAESSSCAGSATSGTTSAS